MKSGDGSESGAIATDHDAVAVIGILWCALLSLVGDMEEAEAVLVSFAPLEVVHDGPVEIAGQRNAFICGPAEAAEVTRQEVDALRIVDLALEVDEIGVAESVFGKCDRELVPLSLKSGRP